jgi:hypothetical protein
MPYVPGLGRSVPRGRLFKMLPFPLPLLLPLFLHRDPLLLLLLLHRDPLLLQLLLLQGLEVGRLDVRRAIRAKSRLS